MSPIPNPIKAPPEYTEVGYRSPEQSRMNAEAIAKVRAKYPFLRKYEQKKEQTNQPAA